MYSLISVFGIIVLAFFLYSVLSVRNIEEPSYIVIDKKDGYEIRKYDSYIIAQTRIVGAPTRSMATNQGFSVIADYIFGNNTKRQTVAMTVPVNTQEVDYEKIAMTVPVNTEKGEGARSYTVSFVMPRLYTLKTLPLPNNAQVQLVQVPERRVAVKRFSWSNTEQTFLQKEQELLKELQRDGVTIVGPINIARYNPPWTLPFMLRNEVQIPIE
tara:strand:- start:70 stop:708 length:639 start_codon:yes stop_codon:yes gene_type:complete